MKGKCFACGSLEHGRNFLCKARKNKCTSCGRTGHLEKVCFRKQFRKGQNQNIHAILGATSDEDSDEDDIDEEAFDEYCALE